MCINSLVPDILKKTCLHLVEARLGFFLELTVISKIIV